MAPKGKKAKKAAAEEAVAAAKIAKAKAVAAAMTGPAPKPKKIPPPPACFGPEDLARFKETFKAFDEDNIEMVKLTAVPLMLRKLGFNPKTAEIQELFEKYLEDEFVDTVEYHEFLFMIEAKMNMGDDFEVVITKAMETLGHDEEESKIVDLGVLRDELFKWGEPLSEIEFQDWIKLATKLKLYDINTGGFMYEKFIEMMNAKDESMRFVKEPINYFKLDQKTLAAMAIAKAQKEREEEERKEAEKKAREEAKRLRMIADGLLPPD